MEQDDLAEQRRFDGLAAMAEDQQEHGAFTAEQRREAAERVDELMGWVPKSGRQSA